MNIQDKRFPVLVCEDGVTRRVTLAYASMLGSSDPKKDEIEAAEVLRIIVTQGPMVGARPVTLDEQRAFAEQYKAERFYQLSLVALIGEEAGDLCDEPEVPLQLEPIKGYYCDPRLSLFLVAIGPAETIPSSP